MLEVIKVFKPMFIIWTVILLAITIKPLGLLLGYLFLGVIILYSFYAIGMLIVALGALLISPFILDNNKGD